jgi:hypothetical protein
MANWDDHADSLPMSAPLSESSHPAGVTLWGLHLAPDAPRAGALLALTAPESPTARAWWAAVLQLAEAESGPDPGRAVAQARRLATLAPRQQAVLAELRRGLDEAAGLPVHPLPGGCLGHHVAVQIPSEADPATFYAYVGGERTPARWLPLVRPLYPTAIASPAERARLAPSAAAIARWLLVPAGPDDDEPALAQAVLGVVKAAEYLGVRWWTRPTQAAAYAAHLTSIYGPDHDAYRPAFDVPARVVATEMTVVPGVRA